MAEQGYNLKYTGKEIDDLLDKANDMDSSAQVPAGGTSGQVLTKKSGTNYDAEWKTPGSSLPSGGTPSQVLTKKSLAAGDAEWRDAPVTLPGGGYAGQILQKKSSTRNDAGWVDMPSSANPLPAGGSAGQALVKNSSTNYDVKWATIQSGGGTSSSDDLLVVRISGLGTSASPFSADKTLDEVIEAYQAGKAVIAVTKDIPLLSGTSQDNSLRCMPLSYYYYYNSTSSSTGITTKYEVAYFCSSYTANFMGGTHCYAQNVYIMWRRNTPTSGSVTETISSSTSTNYTIPYGGKTGQILSKNDDNAYSFNMKWIDPPPGGSGGGITKTELWVSSTNSPSSQDGTTITLSDSFYNYKMVYVCFASKGGTLVTNMQFLNRDKPYMGTYAWTLVAANGSSRAMRLVNETSIQFYNGTNSSGEADATACIITGIYGIN
nr:MAG TPA: hypothetical protein [Bacteriophage sp.]